MTKTSPKGYSHDLCRLTKQFLTELDSLDQIKKADIKHHQRVRILMMQFYNRMKQSRHGSSIATAFQRAIYHDNREDVAHLFLQDFKTFSSLFSSLINSYKMKEAPKKLHFSYIILHTALYVSDCVKTRKEMKKHTHKIKFEDRKKLDIVCKRIRLIHSFRSQDGNYNVWGL